MLKGAPGFQVTGPAEFNKKNNRWQIPIEGIKQHELQYQTSSMTSSKNLYEVVFVDEQTNQVLREARDLVSCDDKYILKQISHLNSTVKGTYRYVVANYPQFNDNINRWEIPAKQLLSQVLYEDIDSGKIITTTQILHPVLDTKYYNTPKKGNQVRGNEQYKVVGSAKYHQLKKTWYILVSKDKFCVVFVDKRTNPVLKQSNTQNKRILKTSFENEYIINSDASGCEGYKIKQAPIFNYENNRFEIIVKQKSYNVVFVNKYTKDVIATSATKVFKNAPIIKDYPLNSYVPCNEDFIICDSVVFNELNARFEVLDWYKEYPVLVINEVTKQIIAQNPS